MTLTKCDGTFSIHLFWSNRATNIAAVIFGIAIDDSKTTAKRRHAALVNAVQTSIQVNVVNVFLTESQKHTILHTYPMATYDKTMQHAKTLAKETGKSHFIFHQPEASEIRDTGWHVIDQTEYYYGVSIIDEQTVRCAVTWDDEASGFSGEEFHPWYYSTWHDA